MVARQAGTTEVSGVSERPLMGIEGSPLHFCSQPRVQATPGEPRELGGVDSWCPCHGLILECRVLPRGHWAGEWGPQSSACGLWALSMS